MPVVQWLHVQVNENTVQPRQEEARKRALASDQGAGASHAPRKQRVWRPNRIEPEYRQQVERE